MAERKRKWKRKRKGRRRRRELTDTKLSVLSQRARRAGLTSFESKAAKLYAKKWRQMTVFL